MRASTPEVEAQLQSCLDAAAEEIDHDLDRRDPLPVPAPAAVIQVNIDRAVEWYKAADAAYGIIGFDQTGVVRIPKGRFRPICRQSHTVETKVGNRLMPALSLLDVRSKAAAALAPVAPEDPNVVMELVDSLEPPVLMLGWDEPWLTPNTLGPGLWTARLMVFAVAGRLMPGEGVATLEELVGYVVGRFIADPYSWPPATATAPRVFEMAGVRYLVSRITFDVAVSVT